ncbi:hypothetical protein EXIGLDRAFT_752386 [Exidia glandulosa HHB12029]|uniref:BAH domain-containing protein n=1 Tax=Exidia glandulosa HHB12029 TaxID=1314781 RepID=A0A165EL41_EXIGL|nr:hypothetical protein EXIGLDRAFT_752386 [Exidia glandulosa HHB12029]
MAPPKRKHSTHFTASKRRKVAQKSDVVSDKDTPTPEEWNAMKSFKRFQVLQQDDRHTFTLGDAVLVLPPTGEPGDASMTDDDFWIARILDIRAPIQEPTDSWDQPVWAKVQWFYKPEDLVGKIKGLKRGAYGSKERIASNHEDLVHFSSCEDIVQMHAYSEISSKNSRPTIIDTDAFYYRQTYDVLTNTLTPLPKTCLPKCRKGYNPDTNTMRVCPSASCARAFHVSCLQDSATSSSIADSPNSSRTLVGSSPKQKLKQKGNEKKIPNELQTLALLPMLKGGPHGVVGNVPFVRAALAILRDVRSGTRTVDPDWQEKLNLPDGVEVQDLVDAAAEYESAECPSCGATM